MLFFAKEAFFPCSDFIGIICQDWTNDGRCNVASLKHQPKDSRYLIQYYRSEEVQHFALAMQLRYLSPCHLTLSSSILQFPQLLPPG